MIYLELFLGFLKVGCFSFGGAYGAIPLIREVCLSNGWLEDEMITYMIAVSESTPGPVTVNLATYVGSTMGGLPGALVATFAVVLPAFIIIIAIETVFNKTADNPLLKSAVRFMTPCVIGTVFYAGISLAYTSFFLNTGISEHETDVKALVIFILLLLLYTGQNYVPGKKSGKIITSVPLMIISAIIGIIVYR